MKSSFVEKYSAYSKKWLLIAHRFNLSGLVTFSAKSSYPESLHLADGNCDICSASSFKLSDNLTYVRLHRILAEKQFNRNLLVRKSIR